MAGDRFEEQLGQGLRRLADQARPSPDARERLHRRVRREPIRRLGIIAASYAMVVAVIAVVAVAFVARTPDRNVTVPPDPGLTSASTPAPTTSSIGRQTTTTAGAAAQSTTTTTTRPGQTTTSTAPGRSTPPPGFADRPRALERAPAAVPRVVRLEVGRHDDEGFDRVVVEFDGPLPGYDVRYVDRVVQDGSGQTVPLIGGADLRIVIKPANAHDDSGVGTLPTPRLTPGSTMVKEARLAGDFEAVVTVGVGVATRSPFRVTELSGPNRLVIDVLYPS
jgi:hypothetical protein